MPKIRRRIIDADDLHGWNSARPEQVYNLALLGGLTQEQMAQCMGITPQTFRTWLATHVSFARALEEGSMMATAKVARALYQRAVGMEYDEEVCHVSKGVLHKQTIHRVIPPDVAACRVFLQAKHRQQWGEVTRTEINQTQNVNYHLDLSNITTEELALMKSIGMKTLPARGPDRNN